MAVMGLSVVMLDYAVQAVITPCESMVADLLQDSSAADDGYYVYSSMLRSVQKTQVVEQDMILKLSSCFIQTDTADCKEVFLRVVFWQRPARVTCK